MLFDRLFRLIFILSVVPLSENSVAERLSNKVNLELVSFELLSYVKKNFSLNLVLQSLASCLVLMLLFFTYLAILVC